MKYLLFLLLLTGLQLSSHAQTFETTTDRTGKKMLKGFVNDSILLADTTSFDWFPEGKRVYAPIDDLLRPFIQNKDSVTFLTFFGTWCPDSRYIIPRFYKIIEKAGIDKKHISLYALDRTKDDDTHFSANLNVTHVPTIIVIKNGKEVGRLVEYGASGRFDEDLAAIVAAAK